MTIAAALNSREKYIPRFSALVNAFMAGFAFDYAVRLMRKTGVAEPYHGNTGFFNFG